MADAAGLAANALMGSADSSPSPGPGTRQPGNDSQDPGSNAGTILRVALTGGIATGKSHVLAALARAGVPTIDTDHLARVVVQPGTPALTAIAGRFGPAILDPSGALDRKALADIVFADPAARLDLEAIVHPAVRAATEDWFATLPPSTPFAVVAIPLLFETGRQRSFDIIVVTTCTAETQLRRVVKRDRLTEAEARRRIAAQLPLDEKRRRADYVIDTEGTIEETDRQVGALARALAAAGAARRTPSGAKPPLC